MPWNDQSGGQGPWGGGPRRPWGQQQPPRAPQGQQGPDLEDMLRQWRERFNMGGGGSSGPARGLSWRLIGGILLAGWLLSGIYTVNETQQAVITRLGDYNRTTGPGIHWNIPAPIEARQVVDVTSQRTEEVGCVTRGSEQCADIADESLMITGDRNIVQIHFRIYYNVSDVEDFVFNLRNPVTDGGEPGAVRQVAESAMREVIGRRQLEPVITTERPLVEQAVTQLAQQVLDEYQAGVAVIRVELLDASAPPAVIAAFNDVVDAGNEAEAAVNNANRVTAQIVNDAQAYKEQVVREATGEAQRFTSVYDEYRLAPQVTRDRLYIETMERVYRSGNLIIMDQRGGAVPYLPLDGMVRRDRPAAQTEQGAR